VKTIFVRKLEKDNSFFAYRTNALHRLLQSVESALQLATFSFAVLLLDAHELLIGLLLHNELLKRVSAQHMVLALAVDAGEPRKVQSVISA
jgi:hypothetical protein